MSVKVLALVTINDSHPMALAKYLEVTEPLLASAGAKIEKRFVINEAIVGGRPARSAIIVDYPSRAAVDAVFQSEEYKSIIPIRDVAFLDYTVTVVSDAAEAEQAQASAVE